MDEDEVRNPSLLAKSLGRGGQSGTEHGRESSKIAILTDTGSWRPVIADESTCHTAKP
ncbi:hypothetical protein D9X30_0117 [Cupriavidus sp. U2]|nr:hypothetical protein D9X30_0117 [Cupriavidus sp. U2]